MSPFIFGLSGPTLTADERSFFQVARPVGYLLFAHNIVDRTQLRALTDSLCALMAPDEPLILVDQEGGRIVRLGPPHWPALPPAAVFGRLYRRAPSSAIEAARLNALATGLMLAEAGISVNCAPLLDLSHPDTTGAIGDRSLGSDPLQVAALGRAVLDGLAAAGILGVIKHMPGHGRATVDSHHVLPRVDAGADELACDLAPFRALASRAMLGMTAHVAFDLWDPDHPATQSAQVIDQVIRQAIGFDGLLMTDDLDMKALAGTPAEKAQAAIAAGCDVVLDGWSRIEAMAAMVEACPDLSEAAAARLARAHASRKVATPAPLEVLIATRDALLALG